MTSSCHFSQGLPLGWPAQGSVKPQSDVVDTGHKLISYLHKRKAKEATTERQAIKNLIRGTVVVFGQNKEVSLWCQDRFGIKSSKLATIENTRRIACMSYYYDETILLKPKLPLLASRLTQKRWLPHRHGWLPHWHGKAGVPSKPALSTPSKNQL
jgi:hypothetical protein